MKAKEKNDEILIGISYCLLGAKVRYDGQDKLDRYIKATVGQFVRFVPVCPEVDIGLGVPREPIRLEKAGNEVYLVATKSRRDLTSKMRRYSRGKSRELSRLGIAGYILKKNSPSCGMARVKVYGRNGSPSATGTGVFADLLMTLQPLLPVEEEDRLNDPKVRKNFFARVFAYRRLQECFSGRWSVGKLANFHAAEKYLLLAHDAKANGALGRLVARNKTYSRSELARSYQEGFMTALAKPVTRRGHVNVLQHMAGFFKESLNKDEKAELQQLISDYRNGLVPLIVPTTLIRHYIRRYHLDNLAGQSYLELHSKELMLQNQV